MAEYNYDRKIFGACWFTISAILEVWWLIAVIVSAALAKDYDCGWYPVSGQDWFVLIILIIIFFGQFSIGELIGFLEWQKSKNENIAYFAKGMIICFKITMGIYVVLNILAIANSVDEEASECMTGQIMLVTLVINLAHSIISFVFCFVTLPLSYIDAPENQNKAKKIPQKDDDETDIEMEEENVKEQQQEDQHLVDSEQKQGDDNTQTSENVES